MQCPTWLRPGRRRNGRCLATRAGSDLRSRWVPEGGKHPGFRKSVPLRGVTPERGPRSVHEGGRSIQPSARRIDDYQGCSDGSNEEGTIAPVVLRQQNHARVGLRSDPFGLRSSALSSNGHRRKRWSDRGRRPQATSRSVEGFRGLTRRRACGVVEVASEELSWLAAPVFLPREGKVTASSPARREREQFERSRRERRGVRIARIGRSGVCPRVSTKLQKSLGGTGSREAPVGAARDERAAGRWAGTGT